MPKLTVGTDPRCVSAVGLEHREFHSTTHAQSTLILSSRLALLIVILKNIFGILECDSQKHILIR